MWNNKNRIFFDFKLCKAFYPSNSFLLSWAEVASSKIIILDFNENALTIVILCFYPPDNLLPPIPTL